MSTMTVATDLLKAHGYDAEAELLACASLLREEVRRLQGENDELRAQTIYPPLETRDVPASTDRIRVDDDTNYQWTLTHDPGLT